MEFELPSVDSWLCNPTTMMRNPSACEKDAREVGSDHIERDRFDSASDRDWCELVRDVVALANSGGGTITIACPHDESPLHAACPQTIDLAASDILHRLARYTDGAFADVAVRAVERSALVIAVGTAKVPLVFTSAGTYVDRDHPAEIHEVFATGSIYFRRGASSETGTSADLRTVLNRRMRQIRKRWLRGVRLAMRLPGERARGVRARRSRRQKAENAGPASLSPVRIVTDPDAPALQPQDVDRLYPWRQKDLVRELNARLGRRALNSYDIQAVRRQHQLDARPDFVFHLEGAGRRYSPAVVDWIMEQQTEDPDFFRRARAADHDMLLLRRRKPR